MENHSLSVCLFTELTQELNIKPPGRSEAGEHIFTVVYSNKNKMQRPTLSKMSEHKRYFEERNKVKLAPVNFYCIDTSTETFLKISSLFHRRKRPGSKRHK